MKKSFAFHGCDTKAGVTMISQSVAQYIAKALPERDILLTSLCEGRNNQFVREDISTFDYYKDKIDSGIKIKKSEIGEKRVGKNLYVVDGIEDETSSRHYFPSSAEVFLENAKEEFDLIIIDTGSRLDNGLSLGGITYADMAYLIISQNEAALTKYDRTKKLYESLDIKFGGYIVNKFSQKDLFDIDYIKRRMELLDERFYKTCDMGFHIGRRAEFEKKTFFEYKNKQYAKDIEIIATEIMGLAGIERGENRQRRHGKVLFG